MSNLEINLLGELVIVHDGSPITAQIPAKSQALLAYLATTREAHSRHALAGLFWGDRSEDKAKNSLRVAITGLRKKIPDHLEITRQSFGLKQEMSLHVDLQQLESVLGMRGGHSTEHNAVENSSGLATSSLAPATSADEEYSGKRPLSDENRNKSLGKVPELYRGDFLSDLQLEEAPEFDEWLENQRVLWRQRALRCLTKLIDHHLEGEAYDEALAILDRHLEIDPCAEEAHRRAMIAHSRKGDLEAALEQYQRCQRALRELLDVDPAPETTAIFANLNSAKAQPANPLPSTIGQGKLIGRTLELERIQTLLADPFCRLVTISGFGGIGKTQLVLALLEEIVQQETNRFLHGVLFVPLVSVDSAYSIPIAIADTLGSPLSGTRNPADELIDMLRGKEMLLILDNFEHLVESGIELVNQILSECSQIELIVTCREWLNVGAEWRFGLDGLPYPRDWANLDLDEILQYPSIELFLSEVKRAQPDFQLGEDEQGPLCQLCELVAGIPLALLLAAARVQSMPIGTIANEVAKNLDILTDNDAPDEVDTAGQVEPPDVELNPSESQPSAAPRQTSRSDVPSRQRSMKVIFESAWNQLLPHEQELFRALSVFREGFTVEAATHLISPGAQSSPWSQILDTLDVLSGHGLVQYDEAIDRYRLHQLLRQFSADKLREAGQAAELVEQRHSNYYCMQLTQWGNLRKGPRQIDAFNAYRADSKNIISAWQTAIRTQKAATLASSIDSLGAFFEVRSNFREAIFLFENAVEMLLAVSAEGSSNQNHTTHISLLSWLANFYRLTGETELAKRSVAAASELLKHGELNDNARHLARAFYELQCGHLKINSNNGEAKAHYATSLSLYQQLDAAWESAVALEALSMVSQSFGDLESAQDYIQQSLSIRQQIDDRQGTAAALSALSTILRFQGNTEEAIRLARESNDLYQSIGDRLSIAHALVNLGMTLNSVGDFEEALELLEESIIIYRSLNNPIGLVKAHSHSSHVAGCVGQFDRASYHANETLSIGNTIDELRWVANANTLMAWHAIVADRFEQALSFAEKSLALAKKAGGHAEEDIARSVVGYAYDGLNNSESARRMFMTVLQIALREHDFLPLNTAVPKIALMVLDQMAQPTTKLTADQRLAWQSRAITAYTVMKRWPVVGTSQLMSKPIHAPWRLLLDALPGEVIIEAESVAATLDIWELVSELIETLPSIGWGTN